MRSELLKKKEVPRTRSNFCIETPKFRRKLIEKYSTRRYNVNTRRVDVANKCVPKKKMLRASKLKQRDVGKRSITNSNLPSSVNQLEEGNTNDPDGNDRVTDRPKMDVHPLEAAHQDECTNVHQSEAVPRDESTNSSKTDDRTIDHPKVDVQPPTAVHQHSSVVQSDFKADAIAATEKTTFCRDGQKSDPKDNVSLDSSVSLNSSVREADFMSAECMKMKLVSQEFYSYLAEKVAQEKAPTQPLKRRKRKLMTKKPKKKKYNLPEITHNVALRDPYLANWENLNPGTAAECEENTALLVHLGVGRPLYPVIHRNIITLCGRKDTRITDMWAEFALSTLTVQPANRPVKPILMPVVDDQLRSAVSDFKRKRNVDFNEVDIKKVKRARPSLPTDIETDSGVSSSQKKQAKKSSSKSRSRSKKGRYRPSLIEQIYRRSLKNKRTIEPITDNSLLRGPLQTSNDEEVLREYGFKPCWVVLQKLKNDEFLRGGAEEKPLELPARICSSTEKKPLFSDSKTSVSSSRETLYSPSAAALKKESTDTKVPIPSCKSQTDSFARQRVALPDQVSPASSYNRVAANLPHRSTVHVQKPPTSGANRTVIPLPTATKTKVCVQDSKLPTVCASRTASSPNASAKKKYPFQDQKPSPPPTIIQRKFTLPDQRSPFVRTSLDAVNKMKPTPSTERTLCTVLSAKKPALSALLDPHGAKRQLGILPVKLKTDTPPTRVTPTVQYEIFSDSVDDEEWISMDHYFGLQHCSRTYGPMIDFIPRNKTLIYYYKMRRLLKFQTKNNKYFQSCAYFRVQKTMEDDFVDIEAGDLEHPYKREEEARISGNDPKTFKDILKDKGSLIEPVSSNPLEIMRMPKGSNAFGLSALKDADSQTQYPFRSIDRKSLRDLSNTKWIIMRLDQDVVSIVFNRQFNFSSKLLFEVMYRADLTKKIIRHAVQEGSGESIGLYGIPGMCDTVILGPCLAPERYHSLQAVLQTDVDSSKTVDIPVTTFRTLFTVNHAGAQNIEAVWWRPVNVPLKVSNINANYLNFLFKWDAEIARDGPPLSKIRVSTINRQHQAASCTHFKSDDGGDHYVMKHNSSESHPFPTTSAGGDDRSTLVQAPNRRAQKRSRSNLSMVQENILPEKRQRKPSSRYRELSTSKFHEQNRLREHLRRVEFRENRALLNSTVAGVKPISPTDVALNRVVLEAVDSIKFLKQRNLDLTEDKKAIMHRRKKLLDKFLACVNAMNDRVAAYAKAREVLSLLVPPSRAQKIIEGEQDQYGFPLSPVAEKLRESPSYAVLPRLGKRRRKRRKKATSLENTQAYSGDLLLPEQTYTSKSSSSFKPVHVTVQSGNHIIGLGPYTEHSYCNFDEVNAPADPPEDPLAETGTNPDIIDLVDDDEDGVDSPELPSETDARESDSINICITHGGQPVFRLVISRVSGSKDEVKKSVRSGAETKKLIQRILQQMLYKLNRGGSHRGNNMNHVQLLQKIVSDTRNDRLFSEPRESENVSSDVVSVDDEDYVYRVQQHSRVQPRPGAVAIDGTAICKIKSVKSKAGTSAAADTNSPSKFVSIDKLIEEGITLDGQKCAKRAAELEELRHRKRSFVHAPSTSAVQETHLPPEAMPEERIIEEECIENSLPVEEVSGSNDDTSFLHSRKHYISVRKNVVITRSQPSMVTLPTMPAFKSAPGGSVQVRKTVPVILRKSNSGITTSKGSNYTLILPKKNVQSLMKIPSGGVRVHCPSFVPVTRPTSSDSSRHSGGDEESGLPSPDAENVTASLPVPVESDDPTLVQHTASPIAAESAPGSSGGDAAANEENGDNDASKPFRLSIKPFASLGTFKDGVCSNVDKLLKF